MKFELHFVQDFSNEKMAYIRIVDIDELNKFGIQNFFNFRQSGVPKTSLYASKFKNHKFEPSKLSQMES